MRYYTYSIILLSHKKEWNNTICSNMAGPRDFHTEWSKVRQREYDIAYIWNITKDYKWTYLQNRSRVTDVENKLTVNRG